VERGILKKIVAKIIVLLLLSVIFAQVLSVSPASAQSGAESGSVSVTPNPVLLGSQVSISMVIAPPNIYKLAVDVTNPDYVVTTVNYPTTDAAGQYQLYYEPESVGTYRVRVWIQGDQSGNPAVLIAQTYFDCVIEGILTGITVENKEPYNLGPCHYQIWDEKGNVVEDFSLDQSQHQTFTGPNFVGIFSVAQDPLPLYDFTNIYAEPNDAESTAWVDGTTAYVNLVEGGGATVTFSNIGYGINYIWATYTGTTLEEKFQIHIWRDDPFYDVTYEETDGKGVDFGPEVLAGGLFHVTVTTKYGYTTDMFIETFGHTTAPEPTSTPTGLEAIINLEPNGAVLITFYSAEVLLAATPLDQPPVVDLTYNIPEFTIVPVQASWEADKNGDHMIDLVAGKATAFLVKVGVPGVTFGITIKELDGTVIYSSSQGVVAANGIVSFYPITLNNPAGTLARNVIVHVEDLAGSGTPAINDVTVTVRNTNDLSLYYGYLEKSAYGTVLQPNYTALVTNSNNFIKGVYPVKNVAASTAYTKFKGQSSMLKDCMMIADAALKNKCAVGVAVAPSQYFSSYTYPNGVGVSYGPNFKGVIVTEGYWTAASHEVAHTYGLYWGEPEEYQLYPPYGQSASGVSAADGKWRSGEDFMGCAPKGTLEYTWVNNDKTYKGLFGKFTTPAVDPEIVIVSGIFHKDAPFEMPLTWSRVAQATATVVAPGDYALRFVDASGNPIGDDVSFDAQCIASINEGVAVGKNTPSPVGIGTIETDEAGFIFAVPYPAETAQVQIFDKTDPTRPPELVVTVPAANIHVVAPVTTEAETGTAGSNGWYVSNVDVSLTGTATDFGVKEVHYSVDSGTETVVQGNTASFTITTDRTHSLSYWAVDDNGNAESPHTKTIKIDKTAPDVTLSLPASVLLNQVTSATWTATDSTSGVDPSSGTVPVDTSSVGIKTVSVTIWDKAGNPTTVTKTVTVKYDFIGFLPPINNDGTSIFKLKSTVPVKFQLRDAQGNYVSTAVASITVAKLSDSVWGDDIEPVSTSAATVGNLFRYDATSCQYIFNLSTKGLSTGTWRISAILGDGAFKTVTISLR
jgi:hypothetical protein